MVIPDNSPKWACYGISVCPARILGNPEVMQDENTHNRMPLKCANVCIPNWSSVMCTPTTDGSFHEAFMHTIGPLRQTMRLSSMELVIGSR